MKRDTGNGAAPSAGATWQTVTLVVTALAGIATLVALTLTLGGANRQRDRALHLQAHSYDVMILARTLAGTIAESEAALGRYVISGDRSLGQLYVDDWRRAGAQIDQLDRITDDNAEQQPRIDSLRAAYEERGRQLALTALSTNYGKNNQALARYYQARKAPVLARIATLLDAIIVHERALLDQRTGEASRGVDRSSHIAGVLAMVGVLLVLGGIALGWLTVRAIGAQVVARGEAEAERARAEELATAVEQATGELRVQEAKLRQVQKMEAVGQLTGGIAHDFNNMLAVVLGGIELARRQIGDPVAVARHLDNAREGAERAAALTRRLLAFSREESLKPETIEPAGLIAGMSELLDRTLGDAITVAAQDDGRGWCVRADRVQLENAILNLAVNARDAMEGRGTLTIVTATRTLAEREIDQCAAGDYATIAVRDTGHGMTADVAERVFEPFFTTKEAGKGTGLGLSQIFALIRQLAGEIVIDSKPGRGTEVTLFLPRDAAATPARPLTAAVPLAAAGVDGDLTVLVVEDDPRVLAATTGALRELGHRVLTCDDPLAAPATVERHGDIDLVLSDVLMPRQTGPEMIAGLLPRFPHLAVLFVTGYAGEANADEFGDHPLLRKPFTLVALERAIGEAMGRDRPDHPARLAAE